MLVGGQGVCRVCVGFRLLMYHNAGVMVMLICGKSIKKPPSRHPQRCPAIVWN